VGKRKRSGVRVSSSERCGAGGGSGKAAATLRFQKLRFAGFSAVRWVRGRWGNASHLGHTDAGVDEGESVVALVTRDVDEEVLLGLEELRVGEALVADLVERVTRVGDELTEEDLLVRVELRKE